MVRSLLRISVRVALVIVFVLGLVVAIATFPIIYNHFVHPLGQLSQNISIGDHYEDVLAKFNDYVRRHKDDEDLRFSSGTTKHYIFAGPTPETRHLYLYHSSAFDDVQLQVLFDETGLVKEVVFIGD